MKRHRVASNADRRSDAFVADQLVALANAARLERDRFEVDDVDLRGAVESVRRDRVRRWREVVEVDVGAEPGSRWAGGPGTPERLASRRGFEQQVVLARVDPDAGEAPRGVHREVQRLGVG